MFWHGKCNSFGSFTLMLKMDKLIPKNELRRQKIRRIIIASGAVLAIGAGVALFIGSYSGKSLRRSQLSFGMADTGNVESTVNASGKVVPAFEEVVVSPVASRILEVYHREGDLVDAGEPLLKLDVQSAEGEVKRLGYELEVSHNSTIETGLENKTRLTNLQMQIEAKKLAVAELHAQVANERRLDSIGSGTGERVRQAELAWRTGEIELEQLRKELANESHARAARLESSRLQEDIKSRSLEEARRVLADAGVKSPRKATITFINSNIGGSVAPGEKLAVLSDLGSFRIAGQLPEGDADKVIPGGEVAIKIGKNLLRGHIVSVTPQSDNGMVGFNVMLDDEKYSGLRPGIRADLNLISGIKEGVVRIPNGPYFHGPGPYRLFVTDKNNDMIEARKVILGVSNFDYVEVISGLKPGERIVISDMSDYKTQEKLKLTD